MDINRNISVIYENENKHQNIKTKCLKKSYYISTVVWRSVVS